MSPQPTDASAFEIHRPHLLSVAQRILGHQAEAEDAVQETWLRWSRADLSSIDNLKGWLTTVVARICIDMLRTRKQRREEELTRRTIETYPDSHDANRALEVSESVGQALLVVLDELAPAERVAFVLHDLFSLPFETIASILNRTLAATRQLASRARRRVQGVPVPDPDVERQREIVTAFMFAAREGNFTALLAALHPDVVLHADAAAISASRERGGPALAEEIAGAESVARIFDGRARNAEIVAIDGAAGFVFAPGGQIRAACEFIVENARIVELNFIADPHALELLHLKRAESA